MIIIDNTMYMQNQDYMPNRYVLQTEIITSIINKMLSSEFENAVGIVPIAQFSPNYLVTPTHSRKNILRFMSNLKLDHNHALFRAFELAHISNVHRNMAKKHILAFIGSPVDVECDDTLRKCIDKVQEAVEAGFVVDIVFFGEARDYKDWFEAEIQSENFRCGVVNENDDMYSVTMSLISESVMEENDPELAMALKMSMEEANKK